jgi:hypothetical protein
MISKIIFSIILLLGLINLLAWYYFAFHLELTSLGKMIFFELIVITSMVGFGLLGCFSKLFSGKRKVVAFLVPIVLVFVPFLIKIAAWLGSVP